MFSYKFFDNNISTLSGFKVALNDDTIFPAVLNSLSEAELVAQTHKYFRATFPRIG